MRYENEKLLSVSVDVFLTLIFVVMFEMDVRSSAREVQGVATSHHDDEHVSVHV